MTTSEIKKKRQELGCLRYDGESTDEYCRRLKNLPSNRGKRCDFGDFCFSLTAEEVIKYIREEGCICVSKETIEDAKKAGLIKHNLCELCPRSMDYCNINEEE